MVVAVGAGVVLYKYSRGENDIQQFASLFNEAILPAANSLRAIGNGSLCFTVQAEDRAALQLLWEQYQDNTLQARLQDFLVTEEIKQLADGEDVIVTVHIDEQEYQDACLDFMMDSEVQGKYFNNRILLRWSLMQWLAGFNEDTKVFLKTPKGQIQPGLSSLNNGRLWLSSTLVKRHGSLLQ